LCPQLHTLYLQNSTKNKDITTGKYLDTVCQKMRGLQTLDSHPNPHVHTPTQWLALSDLRAMTGWYYPNRTSSIDIRKATKLTPNHAQRLIQCLVAIGPKELFLPPVFDNNKNAFVNEIETLKVLNGNPLDEYVRHNAVKNNINQKGDAAEKIADKGFNLGMAADLVDKVTDEAEDFPDKLSMAKEYALMFGTILSKWEIIITFQQILTQIILYIDRIKWPKIYIDLSFLYWIFAIDLSFLNFFLDITMPVYLSYISLFLYTVGPAIMLLIFFQEWDQKAFNQKLVDNWTSTLFVSIYGLFCLVLCSFGLGFIFDFNHVMHVKEFTNNWKAWGVSLSIVSLVILIVFWVFHWYYYHHSKDSLFWSNLNILKRRMSLFGITVLYSPGCKFFVELIRCDDSGAHAYAFSDVLCLNSWNNFTLVHLAAIIFGLTYAISIPLFFVYLIGQGVSAIDKFCGIEALRLDLEKKEAELKKIKKADADQLYEMANANSITLINLADTQKNLEELKQEAQEKYDKCKENLETKYAEQANSYDHPAAYLYNQYSRKDRYTKVIGLVKKLAMMLFTAFVPKGLIQTLATSGLLWVNTFYQCFVKPFIAGAENFLETVAQFGNSITLAIGETLQYDSVDYDLYTQVISPAILVGIVAALAVLFIALVIKYHCKGCCYKAADDDDEYTYEYVSEEEDDEEIKVDEQVNDNYELEDIGKESGYSDLVEEDDVDDTIDENLDDIELYSEYSDSNKKDDANGEPSANLENEEKSAEESDNTI
jgi:hypothetical protein